MKLRKFSRQHNIKKLKLKKKHKIKIKLFEVPQNPINFSPPMLLPQSHGKAHLPSKDTSLLPSKTKIPQSKPTIPTKSMLFSPSHSL